MDELRQRVLSHKPDRETLVRMAREILEISSPTGQEAEVAGYIAERFRGLGLDVRMQEVEANRSNVICTWKGSGGGKSLMLSGHMDTSSGYRPNPVRVEGDWIFGPGATNMKGFFVAAYAAIRILLDAGVRLRGDLLTTAVVGELEVSPVEDGLHAFDGPTYRGAGLGTEQMLRHGVIADMAVIGEPTGLRVQCGNTGYIFAKITTFGKQQHTHTKHAGVSALEKMLKVIHALEAWEPEYQKRFAHPRMRPVVNVSSMTCGRPYGPVRTPPLAHLFVHITTIPGARPLEVKRQIEEVVARAGAGDSDFRAEVSFYMIRPGYEIPQDDYVAAVMRRAHRDVTGKESEPIEPSRYNVSSDGPFFAIYDIPTITYGPGGLTPGGARLNRDEVTGESLNFENLSLCARAYALAAMEACGVAG